MLDWFFSIGGTLWTTLVGTLIPFLFVLTLIVFIHELGHFLVARLFAVKVDSFSIGFGPEIFGFEDRQGTRWKLSWIPLGGFVKFTGDDNAASVPDHERLEEMRAEGVDVDGLYHFKPVWQRALIVAAGPIANFVLAITIFALIAMTFGERILLPVVDEVAEGSPAAEAGFEPGDVVLEIDGRIIDSFAEMQQIVALSPNRSLRFLVERIDGRQLELLATPSLSEVTDRFGNTQNMGRLGITRAAQQEDVRLVRHGPIVALSKGVERTWDVTVATLSYIAGIFVGTQSPDQLGGPLRIAQLSGEVAAISFPALLAFAGLISVSIGLINLFPIPLLDGGHLVFYAYEAVMGRPLSERAQEVGFRIGFALVLALMIYATWNDLGHFRVFG